MLKEVVPCGETKVGDRCGFWCSVWRSSVTAMLSRGSYGRGGAFSTQAWIDPHRDLFVILLIQRAGLLNSDASEMRRERQRIAIGALSH